MKPNRVDKVARVQNVRLITRMIIYFDSSIRYKIILD